MGKLIGSGNTENFGEKMFIDKAQEYLDDTNIIYWNRQIFGREFDVCILMPGKGILVVELKGWREENILRVENNEAVIIRTADGEVAASPQKQARGYRFSIERHLRKTIGKFPLVYQMVCLPQVSRAFFRSHRLDVVMEEKFTILKEDLVDNTAFFNKLDQALREVSNWNRDPFDRRTMLEVRNLYEYPLYPALYDNMPVIESISNAVSHWRCFFMKDCSVPRTTQAALWGDTAGVAFR